VTDRMDTVIDVDFLCRLQGLLYSLHFSGKQLGPHLATIAIRPSERTSGLAQFLKSLQVNPELAVDLHEGFRTVREYFSLPCTTKRLIYEPKIESLLLSYVFGAKTRGHTAGQVDGPSDANEQACGRCSAQKYKLAHETCSQTYRGTELLNGGICNNCLFAGGTQLCSFRRKFLNKLQTATFLVSKLLANSSFSGTIVVPRGVKASGASEGLSDASMLPPAPLSALNLRSASSVDIPAGTRVKDPSSFAWGSERNANKYADHLIAVRKGEDDEYNPSLPSSAVSSDVALSDCLSGSEDLEEDYAPPVKNPRKRRRRSATPDPEVPARSDRPSARLRSRRQALQPVADGDSGVVEADDEDDDDAFLPDDEDDEDDEDAPAV